MSDELPSVPRRNPKTLLAGFAVLALAVAGVAGLSSWTQQREEQAAVRQLGAAFEAYLVAVRGEAPAPSSLAEVLDAHALALEAERYDWTQPPGMGSACAEASSARLGISEPASRTLCPALDGLGCADASRWGTRTDELRQRLTALRSCFEQLRDREALSPEQLEHITGLLDGDPPSAPRPAPQARPVLVPSPPPPLVNARRTLELREDGVYMVWLAADRSVCPRGKLEGGCERLAFARVDWTGEIRRRLLDNPEGLWVWTRWGIDEQGRLLAAGTCRASEDAPMRRCVVRAELEGELEPERMRVDLDPYPQLSRHVPTTMPALPPADAPALVTDAIAAFELPGTVHTEAHLQPPADAGITVDAAKITLRQGSSRMFIERSELERTGPVTPERFVVYEFPPGAMPPATLYLRGADAVVLWGRDSEVLLLSRDGGRSWRGVAEPGQ